MWNSILSVLEDVNAALSSIVWGMPMILLILGVGLLLTVRTGALQVRLFGTALSTTIIPALRGLRRRRASGAVSPFEAFATALSGTVGTGNIIGVVSAILTGGPGAIFWMWVSAFFGMVTNYAENVLGLYFRRRDRDGGFSGGTFYYIHDGLRCRLLASCAAVFCILGAIGMSGLQTNKISATLSGFISQIAGVGDTGLMRRIIGILVAILASVIIIGGIRRIGRVASLIVPLMSLLFIGMALGAVIMHSDRVTGALSQIFAGAFQRRAIGCGILSYSFAQAIRKGLSRGVFSNEAGLGSSVIAHSASREREPVRQGLWGVFAVFFDTVVVCTLTALMFLTTFDARTLSADMDDSALSMSMFAVNFGSFGTAVFSIILPLFAFTTIVAWAYYGETAVGFCVRALPQDRRGLFISGFKVLYIIMIALSGGVRGQLIWQIADTCSGLMALPNLIALIALSGLVVRITRNYEARRRGVSVEPMLSADPVMNKEFIHDIASGESER